MFSMYRLVRGLFLVKNFSIFKVPVDPNSPAVVKVLLFFNYSFSIFNVLANSSALIIVKILIFLKYCFKIFMHILIQKHLRRPPLPTPGAAEPLPLPRVRAGVSAEAGNSSAMLWPVPLLYLTSFLLFSL
jgi:hypothetical protein